MTVHYSRHVTSSSGSRRFGCCGGGLAHLLLTRWRGSIFKLVFPDYLLFLSAYFVISVLYRCYLTPEQQTVFIRLARYADTYSGVLPVSFVLGFYVSVIIKRWWEQFLALPWIDSVALILAATVPGKGEAPRLIRRTIVRQVCLAITQTFALISPSVKRRFPTVNHFVNSGLMLGAEKEAYENQLELAPELRAYPSFWIPISWAVGNVARAREQGTLPTDTFIKQLVEELNRIQAKCTTLVGYDWVNVPLAYTQVVTLSVYAYFLACLMSRQWTPPPITPGGGAGALRVLENMDLFFPFFTTLQFFFFIGWLKVAESLLNPFGDDDDDVELNWIVDRNLQIGYAIVDQERAPHPEPGRDAHWEAVVPGGLPHTIASASTESGAPVYSTSTVEVTGKEAQIWEEPSTKRRPKIRKSGGGFWRSAARSTFLRIRAPRKGSRSRSMEAAATGHKHGGGAGGRVKAPLEELGLEEQDEELIAITTTGSSTTN